MNKNSVKIVKKPVQKGNSKIFLLVYIMPFLLFSIFYVGYLYYSLYRQEDRRVEASFLRTEKVFLDSLGEIRLLSDRIYVNKELQNAVLKQYNDIQEVYAEYANMEGFGNYLSASSLILNYRLYVENPTLLDNAFISKATDKVMNSPWYFEAVRLHGRPLWQYAQDPITKKKALSMVRSVWTNDRGLFAGVLVINVNTSALSQRALDANYSTVLFADGRFLLYSIENLSDSEKTFLGASPFNSKKRIKFRNKNYLLKSKEIELTSNNYMKFNLIYIIPLKDIFTATRSIILISIVMLAAVIFLVTQVYIQRLEKEKLAAKQNEISFKMLATQINPHFLFNTLESIRMKALTSGQKDLSTMLKLLSKLLRYNLSVKGSPVPLDAEVEAAQNYLTIQNLRFGSRVTYSIENFCQYDNVEILPLLIQPIVENSFSHGLENKLEGGIISIKIFKEEEDLYVEVLDNGQGIEKSRLEELQKELCLGTDDTEGHIGLKNVNQRIKIFYGKDYGIELDSQEGEGTKVTLHLSCNKNNS